MHFRLPLLLCALAIAGCTAIPKEDLHAQGLHRVERGDTLPGIARQLGLLPVQLAAWNRISNPAEIRAGVLLRIVAPVPYGFDTIRLPEGYTFQHGVGTDSYLGRIQKRGGLTIHVDTGIGVEPLRRADRMDRYVWLREVQLGGHRADLAMLDTSGKRHLALYYPLRVLFTAEIQSDADIAEFIAILSTYVPSFK